jgi:murein L,D-transpeptidase YcbB/YkuD
MKASFPPPLALLLAGILGPSMSVTLEAQTVAQRLREGLWGAPQPAATPPVLRFYQRRDYRPVWVSDTGPRRAAFELAAALNAAGAEGLNRDDYPADSIGRLLESSWDAGGLVQLELLSTAALLAFAADLTGGRIEPASADSAWSASSHPLDVAMLATALDSTPLRRVLAALAPPAPAYARLRAALRRYRHIAARGGWPRIAAGPDLAPGMRGPRVALVRRRLALESGSPFGGDDPETFDDSLARAVRDFQTSYGLQVDGVVGQATLTALNVPVKQRIRTMELNLERWRWLPRELGKSYVMVNSAAFLVELFVHDSAVLTMRAVVGRFDWPTPIVSARITELGFSPRWEIPQPIALVELLPLIRKDPGYLAREHIVATRDSAGVSREVDPATIDSAMMADTVRPLRLTQAPGNNNPLGGVKFVFRNRFGVRIHDTPDRALFRESVRTFSHGCVRVERAAELASSLLADTLRWPLDSVRARMNQASQQSVPLSIPISVHLAYWTAWVAGDGAVQFRADVYGWDGRLGAALAARGTESMRSP